MSKYYPKHLTCTLILTSSFVIPAFAQKQVEVVRPTSSVSIKLSDFSLPPHAVELIHLSLSQEGSLRYQTLMPIDGRVALTTDEAKLKGSVTVPPTGLYAYTGAVDASGQAKPIEGIVFSPMNTRVKQASDTPVDWAVWGTNAKDGPLRLPYGGDYDRLPQTISSGRQLKQLSLSTSGSSYNLYPNYRFINRFVDPTNARLMSRLEDVALQQKANQEKLRYYIPVDGGTPEDRGQVIALSPTCYEGVATHFVEGDKKASAKRVSLLTFDDAGNLVSDRVIEFPYTRKLSMRLPVYDPAGKVVGTFNVFADGGGKKDVRDPQENRFSVVVTEEKGSSEPGTIWSQFEWNNGEGSSRAILPTYVLRRNDKLLVYSTNGQKLLKPTEESWLIDKSGKATLVGSIPYGEIVTRSKEAGRVNGGQLVGWANYAGAHYIDSFTDANGDVWLLLQRQTDAPGGRAVVSAPSESSPTSRVLGFANKLNQLAGQPTRALAPAVVSSESGKSYTDLFVLHFDADLKLKEQTVVALDPTPEPVRFQRSIRPTGSDYVLNNQVNTRLKIRQNELSLQQLTPIESISLTTPDHHNFLLDEAAGKIYVLYGVPKKYGVGQLLTYSLD
ncbi:hypothetical protein M0L20_22185 [Spirosoma sp. RP8]|uniref:Uncharacterized protein n=1 Tax=Spirosoma liriopis TaxID=2937440 RepID=A0ABT0HR06_9BACT|nr:hypothetical protein [Spirosoma liriopis]MCK8494594.1 hypothetical protein [Spirosoma liriopis]